MRDIYIICRWSIATWVREVDDGEIETTPFFHKVEFVILLSLNILFNICSGLSEKWCV
jgi:hypothetical protein